MYNGDEVLMLQSKIHHTMKQVADFYNLYIVSKAIDVLQTRMECLVTKNMFNDYTYVNNDRLR